MVTAGAFLCYPVSVLPEQPGGVSTPSCIMKKRVEFGTGSSGADNDKSLPFQSKLQVMLVRVILKHRVPDCVLTCSGTRVRRTPLHEMISSVYTAGAGSSIQDDDPLPFQE